MRRHILTFQLATSAAMPAIAQDQAGFGDRLAVAPRPQIPRARKPNLRALSALTGPSISIASSASGRKFRIAPIGASAAPSASARSSSSKLISRLSSIRRARQQRTSDRPVEQQQARHSAFDQEVPRQQGERRAWQQRRLESSADIRQRQTNAPNGTEVGPIRTERQREYRRDSRVSDRLLTSDTAEQNRGTQGQVTVHRQADDRYQSRHSGSTAQWSSQWRSDRNYDWRHHRDRHRSIFRLGFYNDPYGSRYRRFSIGFGLFPSYYQSNYWLDDPWMYRLPPAYGPYRWVRYYGDALLVNIYTGRVVDVVYDFFW